MSSVNKVILVGHLGADPEIRYLPEGWPPPTNGKTRTPVSHVKRPSGTVS